MLLRYCHIIAAQYQYILRVASVLSKVRHSVFVANVASFWPMLTTDNIALASLLEKESKLRNHHYYYNTVTYGTDSVALTLNTGQNFIKIIPRGIQTFEGVAETVSKFSHALHEWALWRE